MVTLEELKGSMVEAQRSGSEDAAEAQRAYESARRQARIERDAAEWRARRGPHEAMLAERLARPVPVSGPDAQIVGVCSRAHAEYIMRAASVHGGAIYVGLNLDFSEALGGRYLALGTIGVQRALPRARVIAALRAELGAMASCHPDYCAAERDEMIRVLDAIEGKS